MVDLDPIDLLVVGGGVDAVGIARDAAGRGLSVVVVAPDDLGAKPPSLASRLAHDLLDDSTARAERDRLARLAPHIAAPLSLFAPHDPAADTLLGGARRVVDRLTRLGSGGRRRVDLAQEPRGLGLQPQFRRGVIHDDLRIDDARLVVLAAVDAAERGAEVLPRMRTRFARRANGLWYVVLAAPNGDSRRELRVRALVDATEPLDQSVMATPPAVTSLVRASHIVLRRLDDRDLGYRLPCDDRRAALAVPYEGAYTLVGTSEVAAEELPVEAGPPDADIELLCASLGRHLNAVVTVGDVLWTFATVRATTPGLDLDVRPGDAPLLTVRDGRLMRHRQLAEDALDLLAPHLGDVGAAWTSSAPLPGGDFPDGDSAAFVDALLMGRPWLPASLAHRYVRTYGTRVEEILGDSRKLGDLGASLGNGVFEAELDYLARWEWAESDEDALWRRTKLGMHVSATTAERVHAWFVGSRSGPTNAHRTAPPGRARAHRLLWAEPELEAAGAGPDPVLTRFGRADGRA